MDELGAAVRVDESLRAWGEEAGFNAMFAASKELGALIPVYDPQFLNALTHIYDNVRYDEKRRGAKEPLIIDRPTLNLLAATTPSFLMETLPAGVWDQGFMSRVILIYKDFAEERKLNLDEEEEKTDERLRKALVHDLRVIANKTGKMKFSREAVELLSHWHSDKTNRPTHPRLQNYLSRRTVHAMKLCIIAAADRGTMIIETEDVNNALSWLTGAEQEMPDLFGKFNTGGDTAVIAETHHTMYALQVRSAGKPIPSHIVYEYLSQRVPSYRVQAIVELMLRAGMMKARTEGEILSFTFQSIGPGLR